MIKITKKTVSDIFGGGHNSLLTVLQPNKNNTKAPPGI